MRQTHNERCYALLILIGLAACGESNQECATPLRLGDYKEIFVSQRTYVLRLSDGGRAEVRSRSLRLSGLDWWLQSGTWTRHGDLLTIKLQGHPSYYIARITPSGVELWKKTLSDLPDPLAFPNLPESVEGEGDPERKTRKSRHYISFLELLDRPQTPGPEGDQQEDQLDR